MKSFRRVFSATVFSLCAIFSYAQNLKDSVCVVQGNLSENNKSFLSDLKDSLERSGYSYYAKYVASFLGGTFGSGFVYYAQDKKAYIVTNRHVVADYEDVNLTFENEDGSTSEFKNLKIVFSDDQVDLALIALPDSFKREGLLFSTKKLSDGEEVYSAGFPSLAGEPSWQLGKGIVSNNSARVKELLDPQVSTLIQHTAQIDGGNSGGPLLVKDSSAKTGYSVCGINTWTAVSRQNTNFAIPEAALESTLQNKFFQKPDSSFENQSLAFIKGASSSDDFTALTPFISNEMISNFGDKALRDVLTKAPSTVRSYISDIFETNPIAGLRYSLAYSVYVKLHSGERLDIAETYDEATGKKVKFVSGTNTFDSFWIEEQGAYKLSEFEGIEATKAVSEKEKARNKNGSPFSLEDPFFISITGDYLRNLSAGANGFGLEFLYRINYVAFGMGFMTDSVKVESNSTVDSVVDFGPVLQLRVPLKFGSLVVLPFGEARAGISFSTDFFNSSLRPLFAGVGGGIELAWTFDSVSPCLGAKYMLNVYSSDSGAVTSNNLVIFAGIKLFSH